MVGCLRRLEVVVPAAPVEDEPAPAPEPEAGAGWVVTGPRLLRMSLVRRASMLRASLPSFRMSRPFWVCCTCKLSTL